MRFYVALSVLVAAFYAQSRTVTHATWDGQRFSCPAHTDLWADEGEALEGSNTYVYCIPDVGHDR